MQKLGGRKFLMALIAMAVGTAVEILGPNGMSTPFAVLLLGLVSAFGITNAMVSKDYFKARSEEKGHEEATKRERPQKSVDSQQLNKVLSDMEQVKDSLAGIGQVSANTHKLVSAAVSGGQ